MLHELLNLTRPLIVLDCETTGLNPQKDRIVEFAFQAWNGDGLEKEFRTLVNPEVPMPRGAEGVHGITDAMLQACSTCGQAQEWHAPPDPPDACQFKPWPRFKQLAKAVATGFVGCDFAGKNVRFDLRMVAAEMARAGVEWSYANAVIIDADRLEALGDPRSLTHLVKKHLNEDMADDAHSALGDVRWTARLIAGQLKSYPNLPRNLEALHKAQWPDWIDSSGMFRYVDGIACFGRWGKHAGRPMNHPEVLRPGRDGKTYYDFIVGADFPPDVKHLAREALAGRFPEVRR